MKIRVRRTEKKDLEFVLSAERDEQNSSFVGQWTSLQHESALSNADLLHMIVEDADGHPCGYIIVAGLNDRYGNIEFRRIVITKKGKGYGRDALRHSKRIAFCELKAHRLWLDVREFNARARKLYETEGFILEGRLREAVESESGRCSLLLYSMLKSEFKDVHSE